MIRVSLGQGRMSLPVNSSIKPEISGEIQETNSNMRHSATSKVTEKETKSNEDGNNNDDGNQNIKSFIKI
jgi:hypothetical protein